MSSIITASAPHHGTISQAEAIKLAKNVSGQNAQLERYQLLPYNDDQPRDRASRCHRLLLDMKSGEESSEIERSSLIVKTISHRCQNGERDFEHETTFYRDIVPELLKHVALGKWIPKCFLAKSDTLVLEDLSQKGYSVRGPIFDEATTKSAVQSVARLHASSILAEARLEQSLHELYPKAFRETTIFTGDGKNHEWFSATIELCIAIADSLGLNSSKIAAAFDRLQQIVAEERQATTAYDQTKYRVASHGNLWADNMMFDANQPPNCVLTGFQCVRYASPAQDLLLLLHLCTTRQFRRSCEQELIEFYHSALRSFAYRYNPAARVPSLDQLKREVEEQRLRAVISAVFHLPTLTLTKDFAADVLEDPVEYDKFHRGDRRQKVVELMHRDVAYRQRIQEAVGELVDFTERFL